MRLCRFLWFMGHRWGKFPDAIPDDPDALNLPAIDAFYLVDVNLLHKLPDHFGGQFLNVGVLLNKSKKTFDIYIGFLLV